MQNKITERSLMPVLSNLLRENGFNNISEVGVKHGYFDFECFYKEKKFIVEIKIGRGDYFKNLLRGVTQAWNYCEDVKGDGILVLEYPAQIRTPLLLTPDIIKDLASNVKVDAIFLSQFFNESFSATNPTDIFLKLRASVDDFLTKKEKRTSFKLIIEALRSGINTIAGILRTQRTKKEISELIDMVVGRFDLFLGLGQIEKSKEATESLKLTAMDLIPYLLSNQILFYHIFSETTGKVSKMDEEKITSIQHLKKYFKEITDINYKAIYSIDLASRLPDQKEIIDEVKEIIKAIDILKPELVKHDLLGRLYHELLPVTTRKILAAFYTNPVAADILAGLTIKKWDNTVIDPSCGSGTLLVAAYKRKLDLYKEKQEASSFSDLEKLHKEFVEEQITGLDIMPFASHLTAVNLAAQTPNAITNKVRVGCQDSLELQGRLYLPEFIKKGVYVEPFQTQTQTTIFGKEQLVSSAGATGPAGEKGERFLLQPVDIVLMNPPFSDREKMPSWYREHLKDFQYLITKCGNQVNFWGFFIALADYLLKENGKMGLVIPINIARGEATKKIRDFLLKNYHVKYILKTTKSIAFSEGASFKDILLIAEKKKPSRSDLTQIIFLQQPLREIDLENASGIVRKIVSNAGREKYVDKTLEIYSIPQNELFIHEDNLMPFLWAASIRNMEISNRFIDLIKKRASQKLIKIEESRVKEGFHTSPKGLSKFVFITRDLDKSRIERALLILDKEKKESVSFKTKDAEFKFEIDASKVSPALRTGTAVKTLDISQKHDYLILDEFRDSKILSSLLKQEGKRYINWSAIRDEIEMKKTHLAISRRFNPYSPNTHLLSFYSKEKFVPSDALKIIVTKDEPTSQILSVFFNSILTLLQIFMNKQQTTGAYADIRTTDLILMDVLDVAALSQVEKRIILNLFNEIKNIEFPSILGQLENRFKARVKLDKTILKILRFSDEEINEWIPKIYDALVEELKAIKEIR